MHSIVANKKRVYGQFCMETLHERHDRIEPLVVCLSEYLPLIWKNQEWTILVMVDIKVFS